MKKIILVLLPLVFLIISCSRDEYTRDYVYGDDGLVYKTNRTDLFSGKIIDTTDTYILQVDIQNGKKNGEYIIFDLKGVKHMHGNMKNNLNEGEWKYYYPGGEIESEGKFINDKVEGHWIFYYPNGSKSEEGKFLNGTRTGTWMFYDSTGRKDSTVRF